MQKSAKTPPDAFRAVRFYFNTICKKGERGYGN
jgi:hypothetical protein